MLGVNFSQIVATIFLTRITNTFLDNRKILHLPFGISFNKNPIRLSISYLHRIAVKDDNDRTQYLLVKNSRVDMFQPPGGVYKYNNKQRLEQLKARDHKYFHEKGDLRIELPKKNIKAFIKAFSDESWREVGYYREFKEELLDTKILPLTLFDAPQFRFIERRTTGIRWSNYFQCDEIIFYDIVEVTLVEKQKAFLNKMLRKASTKDYVFATEDSIRSLGFSPTKNSDPLRISEHSKMIF